MRGCAIALAALSFARHASGADSSPAPAPAIARIEARSADFLAVALVRGDRMTLHLSRMLDNAPVRDATVTVALRGTVYPMVAEADGSFGLQTSQLTLPGAAAVEIHVGQNGAVEALKGSLQVADTASSSQDKNSVRQMGWWVLNFAVCGGFLWLYARRRRKAEAGDG